ncbi:uncharacterized protein LOC106058660 [Biomphalaria glabrata]|uniref:Uncharacterized protein LOC106058660 n=1 Tax=Biomphalaria glabrata TaxID=6526 RepID=A0A2C9KHY9_BIOGL|nr:uncharacterized protein LOC106058660 [Biomphalaria glabrata]XP_013071574.2 uncharacterized protein LOC106058660 [Biomphalaria glabrata]XP_055887905.1 uncharacterized protein LOC106058660 [Biomphalaria glabrata]XP_055887906.1 uncharacterized protein LOC106058660 [Biomphalaria glabrata]XP_055887907.1 uncharacterized protein LOC106058660 [Biomphalaria glabrata]XP_055887908.1 uncharacterized protein LOC106058660 [Biomphalaria glabrata]XP_055887909.1 uncharacterized protein LOC106058660 [Biomph
MAERLAEAIPSHEDIALKGQHDSRCDHNLTSAQDSTFDVHTDHEINKYSFKKMDKAQEASKTLTNEQPGGREAVRTTRDHSMKENVKVLAKDGKTERMSGPNSLTDCVDGDVGPVLKGHRSDKVEETVSKSTQYQNKNNAESIDLPVDFSITPNSQLALQTVQTLCHSLTVKVTTSSGQGSGTLVSPEIWKQLRKCRSLQSMMELKVTGLDLAIIVSEKLIKTELDASQASVEFSYVTETDRHVFVRINQCSKLSYKVDGRTILTCHRVPVEVCEDLEKHYVKFCDMAAILSRDPSYSDKFLLLGHLNGVSKVALEGKYQQGFEPRSQPLGYFNLEESAETFFSRTMNVSPQEWSELKEKLCPGDESMSVVSF